MTITHLNRFHVRAARKGTNMSEVSLDNIFAKIVLPLWISLLEVEFMILITENNTFTNIFLQHIDINNKCEVDKWSSLIDYFFKLNYFNNQKRELTEPNLGSTIYHRYNTLHKILNDDISPFIEMRNRISHGQWAVAFNFNNEDKNQVLTTHIWKLSKKEIMLLKSFVTNFPILIKFLVTSKKTFERDFDKYTNRIIKAKVDKDLKYKWLKKH